MIIIRRVADRFLFARVKKMNDVSDFEELGGWRMASGG